MNINKNLTSDIVSLSKTDTTIRIIHLSAGYALKNFATSSTQKTSINNLAPASIPSSSKGYRFGRLPVNYYYSPPHTNAISITITYSQGQLKHALVPSSHKANPRDRLTHCRAQRYRAPRSQRLKASALRVALIKSNLTTNNPHHQNHYNRPRLHSNYLLAIHYT
jgi:hypothetical protein